MSFLLAQMKELKKTSTYPKPFPIWKGLTVKSQKPPTLRLFWYRGTRDEFFIRLLEDKTEGTRKYRVRLQE